MRTNIKHIGLYAFLGAATLTTTSCTDMLDLKPVSQITPDTYYSSAEQLAAYLDNLYVGFLTNPYNGAMFHDGGFSDGMAQSDRNTDIMVQGIQGNTTLFVADRWEVPAGKNLQGDYFNKIRTCNYFFEQVLPKYEKEAITGDQELVKNYIGEMYFLRAVTYYRALVVYGDFPIIEKALSDNQQEIVEASKRAPRNEVARFILKDLDNAIAMLASRDKFKGQRINKEAASVFKSRVALYEATFEKYHRGSGRVPGDQNWPGAKMSYNKDKSFNIDEDIRFFLTEAMNAAKTVADNANLTENNHKMNPEVGQVSGWNPYFEMYGQMSLKDVPEVLLWREYNSSHGIYHHVPYRVMQGSADGYTRVFAEAFLQKDGKPIYASGNNYDDTSIDKVKKDRDERLQLFVWGESNMRKSNGEAFKLPSIIYADENQRCITGYQPRKYYIYDGTQTVSDESRGVTASPIFRTAEAMLNYMEASAELNGGKPDEIAMGYWKKLRERAGITADIETATINNTDLSKENDFGVYSGKSRISDKWLYNIRRERMCETFSEGLRYTDMLRWRSFDYLIGLKWKPEGVNFWDEMYKDETFKNIVSDGSEKAIVSSKEQSKYLLPYSKNMSANNLLRDGYTWFEAYYLSPIGTAELLYASPDGNKENSNMYQNLYWPTEGGGHAEK